MMKKEKKEIWSESYGQLEDLWLKHTKVPVLTLIYVRNIRPHKIKIKNKKTRTSYAGKSSLVDTKCEITCIKGPYNRWCLSFLGALDIQLVWFGEYNVRILPEILLWDCQETDNSKSLLLFISQHTRKNLNHTFTTKMLAVETSSRYLL